MIWRHLLHFTKNENWGEPDRMNGQLLLLMDAVRDEWGEPFIIHCGYDTDGHSPGSYHYHGAACDFHIDDGEPYALQIAVMENILEGLRVADTVGLGIYPDWKTPGFHLDVRGVKARWGNIGTYVNYQEALAYARIKQEAPHD